MKKEKCSLCGQRRGKRRCPALASFICSVCCGEKRGRTIRCPKVCAYYLQPSQSAEPEPASETILSPHEKNEESRRDDILGARDFFESPEVIETKEQLRFRKGGRVSLQDICVSIFINRLARLVLDRVELIKEEKYLIVPVNRNTVREEFFEIREDLEDLMHSLGDEDYLAFASAIDPDVELPSIRHPDEIEELTHIMRVIRESGVDASFKLGLYLNCLARRQVMRCLRPLNAIGDAISPDEMDKLMNEVDFEVRNFLAYYSYAYLNERYREGHVR